MYYYSLIHPFIDFFLTSLLEYNCFTMVYYFLLYNEVNQLYVYIYIPFIDLSNTLLITWQIPGTMPGSLRNPKWIPQGSDSQRTPLFPVPAQGTHFQVLPVPQNFHSQRASIFLPSYNIQSYTLDFQTKAVEHKQKQIKPEVL